MIWKRLIGSSLSVVLFVTQVVLAHSDETNLWESRRDARLASAALLAPPPATPPTPIQTLLQSSSPELESPTIISIQDVHGQLEAQKNIGQMILSILNEHPDAVVGLEGASGRIPLENFRDSSSFINKEIGSFFLNSGLITGAEYAGFAAETSPLFFGVEDEDLYWRNVTSVKTALALQSDRLKKLDKEKENLRFRKKDVFPHRLLALDQIREAYHDGTITIGDYLASLAELVSTNEKAFPTVHLFQDTWNLEQALDFDRAERERNQFLSRLSGHLGRNEMDRLVQFSAALRSGTMTYPDYYRHLKKMANEAGINLQTTPEFSRYLTYVIQSDEIRPDDLLAEFSAYERIVWNRLCRTAEEKSLTRETTGLNLKEKLIRLQMTPIEWRDYGAFKGDEKLTPFEDFYEAAVARNEALSRNFLNLMSKTAAPIGVLVSGGFHSHGLKPLLSNYSITTVTPKLTSIDSEAGQDYLSVFTRERTPLEKLFESPDISIVHPLATYTNAPVVSQLSNELPAPIDQARREGASKSEQARYVITTARKGESLPPVRGEKIHRGSTDSGMTIAVTERPGGLGADGNFWKEVKMLILPVFVISFFGALALLMAPFPEWPSLTGLILLMTTVLMIPVLFMLMPNFLGMHFHVFVDDKNQIHFDFDKEKLKWLRKDVERIEEIKRYIQSSIYTEHPDSYGEMHGISRSIIQRIKGNSNSKSYLRYLVFRHWIFAAVAMFTVDGLILYIGGFPGVTNYLFSGELAISLVVLYASGLVFLAGFIFALIGMTTSTLVHVVNNILPFNFLWLIGRWRVKLGAESSISAEDFASLNRAHEVRNFAIKVMGLDPGNIPLTVRSFYDLSDNQEQLRLSGLIRTANGWFLRYTFKTGQPYYGEVVFLNSQGQKVAQYRNTSNHGPVDMAGFRYGVGRSWENQEVFIPKTSQKSGPDLGAEALTEEKEQVFFAIATIAFLVAHHYMANGIGILVYALVLTLLLPLFLQIHHDIFSTHSLFRNADNSLNQDAIQGYRTYLINRYVEFGVLTLLGTLAMIGIGAALGISYELLIIPAFTAGQIVGIIDHIQNNLHRRWKGVLGASLGQTNDQDLTPFERFWGVRRIRSETLVELRELHGSVIEINKRYEAQQLELQRDDVREAASIANDRLFAANINPSDYHFAIHHGIILVRNEGYDWKAQAARAHELISRQPALAEFNALTGLEFWEKLFELQSKKEAETKDLYSAIYDIHKRFYTATGSKPFMDRENYIDDVIDQFFENPFPENHIFRLLGQELRWVSKSYEVTSEKIIIRLLHACEIYTTGLIDFPKPTARKLQVLLYLKPLIIFSDEMPRTVRHAFRRLVASYSQDIFSKTVGHDLLDLPGADFWAFVKYGKGAVQSIDDLVRMLREYNDESIEKRVAQLARAITWTREDEFKAFVKAIQQLEPSHVKLLNIARAGAMAASEAPGFYDDIPSNEFAAVMELESLSLEPRDQQGLDSLKSFFQSSEVIARKIVSFMLDKFLVLENDELRVNPNLEKRILDGIAHHIQKYSNEDASVPAFILHSARLGYSDDIRRFVRDIDADTGLLPDVKEKIDEALRQIDKEAGRDRGGYWIDHPAYKKAAAVIELARNVFLIPLATAIFTGSIESQGLIFILTLVVIVSIPLIFKYGHVPGRGWDVTHSDPAIQRLTQLFAISTLPLVLLPVAPVTALIIYGLTLIPLTVLHHRIDNPGNDEYLATLAGPLQRNLLSDGFNFVKTRRLVQRHRQAPHYTKNLKPQVLQGFQLDALLNPSFDGTEVETQTQEHILNRVRESNPRTERHPDIIPVQCSVSENPDEAKTRLRNALLAMADEEGIRPKMESYLERVVLVPVPNDRLIKPSDVLRGAMRGGLALQGIENYRYELYTATPDQIDMNDSAARFIVFFLLPGRQVLPLTDKIRSALQSAFNA